MHAKSISRSAPVAQRQGAGRQHWEQGVSLSKLGEWRKAARSFAKACDGAPRDALYRLNWARALQRSGQTAEAQQQCRLILGQDPRNLLAYQLLAECHVSQGEHVEASNIMLSGLQQCEPTAEYLQVTGNVLFSAQRYREGVKVLMDALALQVDHAMSHYRLGLCFNALGMKEEAAECLKTSLVLGIGEGVLACRSLIAFIHREECNWSESAEELALMNAEIDQLAPDAVKWSSVFAAVTLTPDVDRHLKAARATANFYGHGVQPLPPKGRTQRQKIRLGMVSADFHHHATCLLMAELIERLDRSVFEVILYSHGPDDGSAMRRRIVAAADRFHDVSAVGDKQVAELVRSEGVDVLLDLKGHTINCRLGIFAYRAAPIQATYLGFPGTSGASYIDYFIGDPWASPLSEAYAYSEKLALMPVCYQPNDRQRPRPQPTTRAEHGLPEDAVVLCGFNQPYKLSPELLDVWCDLLRQRPQTVLWLLHWNDVAPARLRQEVANRGIAPERVIFAPKLPIAQHISRFALADIYLDIWPCNGHTTVSDALWAGVPVVTQRGHSFASRVASSLLHAVGLEDGVTDTTQAYGDLVLKLVDEPATRARWREQLTEARDRAELFDTDRFAADFGQLVQRMVERLDQGLPPEHLAAQPVAGAGEQA